MWMVTLQINKVFYYRLITYNQTNGAENSTGKNDDNTFNKHDAGVY